jgi:hypothetical protein
MITCTKTGHHVGSLGRISVSSLRGCKIEVAIHGNLKAVRPSNNFRERSPNIERGSRTILVACCILIIRDLQVAESKVGMYVYYEHKPTACLGRFEVALG